METKLFEIETEFFEIELFLTLKLWTYAEENRTVFVC